MKLKAISSSVLLALLPVTGVYAAAMDRSGQSISAFLQPNNYVEAGISILDPTVSGKSKYGKISDMADDYYFPSAAIKLQPTKYFSWGLIYDQPFGAAATYTDGRVEATGGSLAGTTVDVNTNNLTMLIGFQPTENFNIYGGGVYQDVEGDLYMSSVGTGYKATFKNDTGAGWLAGAAFQIPDIALKAAVTYRSEINHSLTTYESMPTLANTLAYLTSIGANSPTGPGGIPAYTQYLQAAGAGSVMLNGAPSKDTKIKTPQSVNIDFQTGIMANTVAFLTARWVEWDGYAIDVDKFRQLTALSGEGQNIIQYTKDQWTINVGLGRKFNDHWAANISAGWDSGAGDPVTALGPTEGYWNVGLGAQYSPTPASFISGGVKYFGLGDANGITAGNAVGKFESNSAVAYGIKMGYRF